MGAPERKVAGPAGNCALSGAYVEFGTYRRVQSESARFVEVPSFKELA